jgi:hypothetical protein
LLVLIMDVTLFATFVSTFDFNSIFGSGCGGEYKVRGGE